MIAAPSATLARRIADRLCEIHYEELPPAVVEKAKDHVMFHVGSAIGGRDTEVGRTGRAIAARLGTGAGPCTIVGDGTASAVDAAFANAAMIIQRGDDYLLPAGGHPGIVTIPAALALAEQEHRSGKELLLAVVVGYELLGRLADLQWGWSARTPTRATIPFGPFGPAAAAIRLLGLGSEEASHAIGFAASMAMGLAENPFGGLYYGWVARNGIAAAIAARSGGRTPPLVLEGTHGFFKTFLGEIPDGAADLPSALGRGWEIADAQLKRWDTTGMNYPAIELMLQLIAEHDLRPSDVERIAVRLSKDRENHSTGHALAPFASRWHAVSSGPFHLAIALLDRRIDEARYDRYDDPEITDVIRRIDVRLADTPTRDHATIEITTTDGRRVAGSRDRYVTPPGSGRAWLRDEARRVLGPARAERVVEAFAALEHAEDVAEVMTVVGGSA